jgi:hypothetical protein
MTSTEFEQFLSDMPAEERKRLVTMGKQYGSSDTLAQADQTLNALAVPGQAAKLVDHGYGADDVEQLALARTSLEQAGGRQTAAQVSQKTTNQAHAADLASGKRLRKKALAVLENVEAGLRKKTSTQAAVQAVAAVLEKTRSAGADARALASQLELISGLFKDTAAVAAEAASKGGPKLVADLDAAVVSLRADAPTAHAPRGTPAETERMDLLDGLIIESTRRARKAARSASDESGEAALATAFDLDKLYRSGHHAKASAQLRAKLDRVVKALAARGLTATAGEGAQLRAVQDPARLDRWLAAAPTVTSVASLLAIA